MQSTRVIFDCPVPPWLVLSAGAILLAGVVVFVARDTSRAGLGRAGAILALSAVGLLLLLAAVLSPRFVRTLSDSRRALLPILVDGSRSMELSDRYSGPTAEWLLAQPTNPGLVDPAGGVPRTDVVSLLLGGGPEGWRARLGRQFDLPAWRFAGDLTAMHLDDGPVRFRPDPEGYSTALGTAMDRVVHEAAAAPRAVILITDGAWNSGRDPAEVARVLGRLGIPVYVVGIGDPDPPRDVAVLALNAPPRLLLGDELILTAEISTSGIGAVRIPVELVRDGQVIDTKQIVGSPAAGQGRPITVKFTLVPEAPGLGAYAVRVAEQPGEQDTANNRAHATVLVDERKIRILIIDSEPRWQFRFLRNAFERDPAVTLKLCLLRPGVGPIAGEGYMAEPPSDRKELSEFDLIILGDVERARLSDGFLTEVSEMIRLRGGGLMVLAGRKGHYRQLQSTPLADILPVRLEGAFGMVGRGGAGFVAELTEIGRTHLMTRLASDAQENELIWRGLPALRWCAPVAGVAPGADSLLVHPNRLAGADKLPLLAVHQVGAGKVMFCGIDETWRWRREVGDKHFYRFWAQSIRWMVKRPFGEGDPTGDAARARLSLDRDLVNVGETVHVEAFCIGPDGYPLNNAQVWLRIEPDAADAQVGAEAAAEQVAMRPAPGGWGIYRATFASPRPGKFVIRPIVSAYGGEPLDAPARLTVERANLEKNFLAQDRATLTAIAEAGGGRLVPIHEIDTLADLLSGRSDRRPLIREFSPTRHWGYYLLIVLVLSTLWFIRKRTGLA